MAIDAISYLYAATVAAGGIIGYVKAGKFALIQMYFFFVLRLLNTMVKSKMIEKKFVPGSIPSLGAGLAFGAILGNF